MKKVFISCICIFIGGFFLAGCDAGNSVSEGVKPKIVVLSPEIAEIISALGGEKNIVALTNECDFPSSLQKKPKVGSFSSPNIEAIVSLEPDIVFVSALEQEIVRNNLKKLGLTVYQFYPQSIEELLNVIKEIGNLIGKSKEAEVLIQEFRTTLSTIAKPVKTPKVYVEIYNNPLMTVSSNSFIGDLIHKSGGKNIFPELPREYCRVTPESVVARDPDIIIVTYPGITKKDIMQRAGWEQIGAVQNGRIYTQEDFDMELIVRAGPRSIHGIRILSQIFQDYK
ncbi:MAG: helical backbone metal receptor [Candidatus Cloacimonadia bacterium]